MLLSGRLLASNNPALQLLLAAAGLAASLVLVLAFVGTGKHLMGLDTFWVASTSPPACH